MQTVIDGKELASDILAGVREEVLHFKKKPVIKIKDLLKIAVLLLHSGFIAALHET